MTDSSQPWAPDPQRRPPPPPTPPTWAPSPGQPPPKHDQAITSMVLGIAGLASLLVCCGALLVVSPVAWTMGTKAVAQIDASGGALSGRGEAEAGRIMGMIGTILLPFVVLFALAYLGFMVAYLGFMLTAAGALSAG